MIQTIITLILTSRIDRKDSNSRYRQSKVWVSWVCRNLPSKCTWEEFKIIFKVQATKVMNIPWLSVCPQPCSQLNRICSQLEACIHCHLRICQSHSTTAWHYWSSPSQLHHRQSVEIPTHLINLIQLLN